MFFIVMIVGVLVGFAITLAVTAYIDMILASMEE